MTGDDGSNTALQGPDGEPALIIAHDGSDWGGGHATSDAIFGGAGNDTLVGKADDGLLRGGGADDSLLGRARVDSLHGGARTGTLSGEAGADVFGLATGSGQDVSTDVDTGDDHVEGRSNDHLDVLGLVDARGNPVKTIDVALAEDGNGNAIVTFPGAEKVTSPGRSPASDAAPGGLHAMGIPNLAADTAQTLEGPRLVQELKVGDMVIMPQGAAPILWRGARHLTGQDLTGQHLTGQDLTGPAPDPASGRAVRPPPPPDCLATARGLDWRRD